jgi:hypothetical protein
VPALFLVSYALLMAAWVVGNPPNAAQDEWSHYLRAVAMGHGQLLGQPARNKSEIASFFLGPRSPATSEALYDAETNWVAQNTRRVHIPAGLTPGWLNCPQANPYVSAACLTTASPRVRSADWLNPTASYQPAPYLLLALVSRVPVSPDNLDRLMRLSKAFLCMILLAIAVAVLWQPGSRLLPFVGLVVALTPTEVFLASSLNPSGFEIAASVAFCASLLRLTRDEEPPRLIWLAVAISGAALALSRTPGPLWVVLGGCLLLALIGPKQTWMRFRRGGSGSYVAAGAIAAAIVLNRVWESLYGPHLAFDPSPVGTSFADGYHQFPAVLQEQVGGFDYYEFGLPQLAYTAWYALFVGLIVIALVLGTNRERLVLAGFFLLALVLPVLLVAATMRHTGFGLQGRYVLPCSVLVLLLAGEILVRRRDRLRMLGAQGLFFPFALAAGSLQLLGWWANAHRFAVGLGGPRWFFDHAQWSPPGGWWPWFTLVVAGAVLLAALGPIERAVSSAARRRGEHELDRVAESARASR